MIKLEDYFTKERKAEFFIRGGDKFGIEVPAGTYRLKWASGEEWFGMQNLFGSRSSFSEASDSFTVSDGIQWTVELTPRVLGNLKSKTIDAEDF